MPRGAERVEDVTKDGPFADKDPLVPVRWAWNLNHLNKVARSTDAHGGKYALALVSQAGGGGSLSLGWLEVVPGAKYSFGVWAKGSGDVAVEVIGEAPEGGVQLGVARGKAGKEWTQIGGQMEIPGHIRLVGLRVNVGAGGDGAGRRVHRRAAGPPLQRRRGADQTGRRRCRHDLHGRLRPRPAAREVGDEGQTLRLKRRAVRRGLRMDGGHMRGGLATIPFRLPAMPKQGTLEFWLSADEMPNISPKTWSKPGVWLSVQGAAGELFGTGAFSDSSISCHWLAGNDKRNGISAPGGETAWRMHKGEWHHFAVTWCPAAWRFYVDGVLAGMTTTPPLKWADAPSAVTVGSPYDHSGWDGVIDEIRISKVERFGPVLPKGATPSPLPVPEEPAAAPRRQSPRTSDPTARSSWARCRPRRRANSSPRPMPTASTSTRPPPPNRWSRAFPSSSSRIAPSRA